MDTRNFELSAYSADNSFQPEALDHWLESLEEVPRLGLVAKKLGVTKFVRSTKVQEAAVIRDKSDFTVVLNPGKSDQRHRFSVAHELGHILVDPRLEFESRVVESVGPRQDDQLERMCDKIAAKLLMPRKPFLKAMGTREITPRLICDLASRFHTSIHATARRLCEVTSTPVVIVGAAASRKTGRLAVAWSSFEMNHSGRKWFIPKDKHLDHLAVFQSAARSPARSTFRSYGRVDLGNVQGHYEMMAAPLRGGRSPFVLGTIKVSQPLAVGMETD